jgi:hypothetical protein
MAYSRVNFTVTVKPCTLWTLVLLSISAMPVYKYTHARCSACSARFSISSFKDCIVLVCRLLLSVSRESGLCHKTRRLKCIVTFSTFLFCARLRCFVTVVEVLTWGKCRVVNKPSWRNAIHRRLNWNCNSVWSNYVRGVHELVVLSQPGSEEQTMNLKRWQCVVGRYACIVKARAVCSSTGLGLSTTSERESISYLNTPAAEGYLEQKRSVVKRQQLVCILSVVTSHRSINMACACGRGL